jgi:hypothetical protein
MDHDREHPAAPEQIEEGFETGQESADDPEAEQEGRFSEGQEKLPESEEDLERGRFSEGEEELPDTPEKTVERRYSEGQEHSPPPQ